MTKHTCDVGEHETCDACLDIIYDNDNLDHDYGEGDRCSKNCPRCMTIDETLPGPGLIDVDWETQQIVHHILGAADWIYDPEIGHIPCCTHWFPHGSFHDNRPGYGHKCGNGPLTGSQVSTGDCGQHD